MRFYFSGLKSKREVDPLLSMAVAQVLVDPHDLRYAAQFAHVVLDSGAYRRAKKDSLLQSNADFLAIARSRQFDAVVANDVFGDAEASLRNYLELRQETLDCPLWPVWPFGTNEDYLYLYLATAQVVGIGGLVPLLRNRKLNDFANQSEYCHYEEDRQRVLDKLLTLTTTYPNRFHAFGLCNAAAIDALHPTLYSADTSHWMTPRRSGLALCYEKSHLSERYYRYLGFTSPDEAILSNIKILKEL